MAPFRRVAPRRKYHQGFVLLQVHQMVSLEKFKPRLKELLYRSDAPGLVSNAVWILSVATALQQRHLKPVDILEPLLHLLSQAVSQVGPVKG